MNKIKLYEICDILNGYAFKSINYVDTGIRVIRITNVQNGYIEDKEPQFYPLSYEKEIQKYILKENDILISLTGNVGRVALLDKKYLPAALNQRVACLRLKNDIIYKSFLFHFLNSDFFENKCISNSKGIAQLNLSTEWLKNYEIPLYEFKQQIEIANKFDVLSKLIDNQKSQLIKLEELVKSRFIELFNCCDLAEQRDDWQPISKIGTIISGSTPKTTIAEYWDGEYRWITPAEIDNAAGYIYDSQRKITLYGAKSCSLTELPIGTVILTSRAPIGKVALAGNTFFCNQGFKNIVCNNRINPLFLYTLLRLNTDYLNSLGRGATFKEISKKIVENIKIPVPSMNQQDQFADLVKQVDKSKFECSISLNLLKSYNIHKYFQS